MKTKALLPISVFLFLFSSFIFSQNDTKVKNTTPTNSKEKLDETQKTEIKTDEKNRQYKIVEGRKVLVDNQGIQSLSNPENIATPATKKEEATPEKK